MTKNKSEADKKWKLEASRKDGEESNTVQACTIEMPRDIIHGMK
jgi:hypothetical protein